MQKDSSESTLKRDKNTEKQIVESFAKQIHNRYKDGDTLIKRIDCEFSEYTKEYFGIVEGIKLGNKDFVEVYKHGINGWNNIKFIKPEKYTQRINSFLHNYFQFDFDTITIGITNKLASNLIKNSEQTKEKSIGNAIAIIMEKSSNRNCIEIFDCFMTGNEGEFHMEVMEPVYQKTFIKDNDNKNMEER